MMTQRCQQTSKQKNPYEQLEQLIKIRNNWEFIIIYMFPDPTDDRNNQGYPPMGGAPYPPAAPGYGTPGYQGQGYPTVGFVNPMPAYPPQQPGMF